MSESTTVLTVTGLSAWYSASKAVDDVTLTIPAGTLAGVIGANGAGKSTLVNAIAGWGPREMSIDGRVSLSGQDVSSLPTRRRTERGMVLVPESRAVFGDMTVMENLQLASSHDAGVEAGSDRKMFDAAAVLDLFPPLADRRRRSASTLSGGERQMLAIGRALACNPTLLMLDEPSIGLAPRLVDDVLHVVRSLVDGGLTVLLVEQKVPSVLEIADYVYVMRLGRMIGEGHPEEMSARDDIVDAYLGELGREQ